MNIHHISKHILLQIFIFIFFATLQQFCKCLHVEIDITDQNTSLSLKIICGKPSEALYPNSNFTALWHGTKLGEDELRKVSEKFDTDILAPNLLSISSSKIYLCYLLAPEKTFRSLKALKKRVVRDELASVPMENGVCQPGYRIDQDRCFPCFPGSFTSGQDTKCYLCPKDYYMDKSASDACWPCPEGKKTLAQGADSEESCVYVDETGHAKIEQTPPWIAIYCAIGVILLCVWIIIIVLLIRLWKHWKEVRYEKTDLQESRTSSLIKKRLLPDKNIYESIPSDDVEEPIYEEISDEDTIYEIPKKPSDPHTYLDLDAPPLPPRPEISDLEATRIKSSEDQYEVPIKRSTVERRKTQSFEEVPKNKSSKDHEYDIPTETYSEDQYEVPIKKSSSNQYEVPIRRSSDHIYDNPLFDNSEDQYEVPIEKSSGNQYEVPFRRTSDHMYDNPSFDNSEDHIYNTIASEENINSAKKDYNNENIRHKNSLKFNPSHSASRNAR